VADSSEQSGTFVSSDEAKAVQKLSDFGTTAVTETGNLARYVGRILGTAPADVVGLVLGDPLHFVRTVIADQYDRLLTKILRDRNVSPQPVSPSLAIPLIRAAYDESRPELQEFWAQLMAAAMDPARGNRVRRSFIDTVQKFDPLDAIVLKELFGLPGSPRNDIYEYLGPRVNADHRELEVTFQNLESLRCVSNSNGMGPWRITSYGYRLVLACSD
jgi:hypothetical protein